MKGIGKIVGFPVKLFSHNMIYLPMEYLRYYGISVKKDRMLLLKSEHSLYYKPLPVNGKAHTKKDTVAIRVGLTTVPAEWIRQNGLKKGDTLFLLGTISGMLLYIRN